MELRRLLPATDSLGLGVESRLRWHTPVLAGRRDTGVARPQWSLGE